MGGEDATVRRGTSAGIRAAFGASPVPTAITRVADGVIVFANGASEQILGWPGHELVGRTMAEVGFWSHPEHHAQMLEELERDGIVTDYEQGVTTRGGERRTVLVSISHVELDGDPCLIGHIHDITERRPASRPATSSARSRRSSDSGPRRPTSRGPGSGSRWRSGSSRRWGARSA